MKILLVKDRNVLNTKFLTQFANNLAAIGHDVHVVCDSYSKPGSGESLDPGVRFTNLSARTANPLLNLWRRLRRHLTIPSFRFGRFIRRERPDVVICYFLTDLFNVAFLQPRTAPIILMGHNYPPEVFEKLKRKSALKRAVYRRLIESVDVFQVLNKEFEATVAPYYNVRRVVTIGNAVVQIAPERRADLSQPKHRIIYVGRLAREGKRQHLLVEAFARVADRHPEWTLDLWGLEKHPAYRQELLALIEARGLTGRAFVRGYTRDIEAQYRQADINAFPSKREGFGLGLADGMAMGLPSIGFRDAPSVNQLIRDGVNGFLVADLDEFAARLDQLMSDQALRIRFGAQAAADMARYAPATITAQWDRLIHETVTAFRREAAGR